MEECVRRTYISLTLLFTVRKETTLNASSLFTREVFVDDPTIFTQRERESWIPSSNESSSCRKTAGWTGMDSSLNQLLLQRIDWHRFILAQLQILSLVALFPKKRTISWMRRRLEVQSRCSDDSLLLPRWEGTTWLVESFVRRMKKIFIVAKHIHVHRHIKQENKLE